MPKNKRKGPNMMALDGSKKDFLTNCYIKEDLQPFIKSVWMESQASKVPFSILLIDVDHFKSFNDKYGHLDGDDVLKYFSSTLRLSLGEQESVPFRFGGDEFVIIFPGKTSAETYPFAVNLAKNIKSRHFLLKGRQFKMSFSGGIASYPKDGQTVEDILDRADKAMYCSKRNGHGNTTQYSRRWLKSLRSLSVFAFIIAVGIAFVLSQKYGYKIRFQGAARRINAIQIMIPRKEEKELDTVYLSSGGVLKGTVIKETAEDVELSLRLDRGQGVMMLKKSDIKRIERAQKPASVPPAE